MCVHFSVVSNSFKKMKWIKFTYYKDSSTLFQVIGFWVIGFAFLKHFKMSYNHLTFHWPKRIENTFLAAYRENDECSVSWFIIEVSCEP